MIWITALKHYKDDIMDLDQNLAVNFKLNTLIDTINQLTITELQDFAEYIYDLRSKFSSKF